MPTEPEPTDSLQSGQVHPEAPTASQSNPDSGPMGQEAVLGGQPEPPSDEHVLHELEGLFVGIENTRKRSLISTAILRLRAMQAKIPIPQEE